MVHASSGKDNSTGDPSEGDCWDMTTIYIEYFGRKMSVEVSVEKLFKCESTRLNVIVGACDASLSNKPRSHHDKISL